LLLFADVIKFFGCELGAQTKFDKKTGTSIVNGAHDQQKLAEVLESFIKKYVQCYSCGNPETVVKVKKDNIFLKCKACGFVSQVDPGLKLNTFIIKNPPENKLSKAEKKVKKAEKERLKGLEDSKEDKKKKKKSSKKDKDSESQADEKASDELSIEEEEEEEEDDVVWMTDTSTEAMQQRAAEQLSGATAAMVTQGNLEAEREAARKREEKRKAAEKEEKARLEAEAAKLKLHDPSVALAELLKGTTDIKALEQAFTNLPGNLTNKMNILYDVLFGDLGKDDRLSNAFEQRCGILQKFAETPAHQLAQMIAFEVLISKKLKSKIREVPLVLKMMFEEDIIDEAIIIGWYEKTSAAAVMGVTPEDATAIRDAGQPVVQWLEEAESETDSDEE
jgi:translation initiation factor 5